MNIKKMALFTLLFLGLPTAAQAAEPLKIVASFSILADMARTIGGEDVAVISLVGPDQDTHGFQPSPDQAKALTRADIVIVNGLKFEGWMHRLIEASGTKAKLLVASSGVKPRLMQEQEDQHHDHGGQTSVDPHAWQDLRFGALYARNIAGGIVAARPELKEKIEARLKAYRNEMAALNNEAKATFAAMAKDKRKIITSHDAFGYLGDAYDIAILSAVGISTEAEPSAADVARLIKQIRQEKASALFIENMSDPRLIEQIGRDTGAKIGGKLYADALSAEGGQAPTYLEMMRHNIALLTQALR